MLKNIVTFVLSRRPIVLLGLLVFFGAGGVAYYKLNIEAYPNPAPTILQITAQAPGLSAEEMERLYTRPLEVGLSTTPNLTNIRSTSFYGLSFVTLTFQYGVDYYFAYTMAALNLQQNVSLPNDVQPEIQSGSLVGEILRYQLKGPPHVSTTELRTLQDWVVTRRLLTVPGVMQVVTWGGLTKEYHVEADLKKLEGYKVTLPDLIEAIGNANSNVGGRTVNIGQQSVNIRGVGLIRNTDDIGNIVLSQFNNTPVLVKDVANVAVSAMPRLGKSGRDDQDDVVTGIVIMNRTLRTNEVLKRVVTAVEKINREGTLPAGVKVEPFYDRSTLVAITTQTVMFNLVFGCLLVFFIQFVFLGDLRSAIIVSATIPVALFFSIIMLVLRGDSANLLSLGAIDLGIIVDVTVILVENIFFNLQKPLKEQEEILGNTPSSSMLDDYVRRNWTTRMRMLLFSTTQVSRAILFSSLIIVAAFIPLFTMQGVAGQIFNPMARTYAFALIGALLATFTVTPVLASMLLPKHVHEAETIVIRATRKVYLPVLHWVLEKRKITVMIGCAFMALTMLLVLPRVGSEFLPSLEEGNLWIRATMPTTISLEAGMDKVRRMRQILNKHPEVLTVISQHGRPDDGSDAAGFYNVELFVPLKPFNKWPRGYTKSHLIRDLQKQFRDEFTGIEFSFSQYIQDNIEEGMSGVKSANSVKIIGPDLIVLEDLANKVLNELRHVRGVEDLGVFRVLGQPNYNITVDRARAARYGLNVGDINDVIKAAAAGTVATMVQEEDRLFALVVLLAPQYRSSLDAIRNIKVGYTTQSGSTAYIPLSELATISLDTGASFIFRDSNQRNIPVKFSVRGRDLGSTVKEAQERVNSNVVLPYGYRLHWAGEFDQMLEAKQRLLVMVPISLIMILVLLYSLFNSFRDSLLAFVSILLSVAGGIIALFVTGHNLSISALIGFVSLFGVSVMNFIILITYFNQLVADGMPYLEAMHQAAKDRMRPMLMTSMSACIGLFPAAISTGIGSQVQKPLAVVVVGGMLIGPIMLLIVAPALQVVVREWDSRRKPLATSSADGKNSS